MNLLSFISIGLFITLFAVIFIAQTIVLARLKKYHKNKPSVAGIGFNPIVGSLSQIVAMIKFLWYARYKDLGDKALVIECNVLRFSYILYGCSMVMVIVTRW